MLQKRTDKRIFHCAPVSWLLLGWKAQGWAGAGGLARGAGAREKLVGPTGTTQGTDATVLYGTVL